jgi:hypothetical protein
MMVWRRAASATLRQIARKDETPPFAGTEVEDDKSG